MRIVVLGESAVTYAAGIGARPGVSVTVIADPATGWANARALASASDQVVLADLVGAESVHWTELLEVGERLVLSRRLRFDRTIATARQAIRAGDIGELRSAHLTWSFSDSKESSDPIEMATELVDATLWLLDDGPRSVYALRCADGGPPFISVNLQTRRGFLALLEGMVSSAGLPPFRDVSLLGSDGAIYHRAVGDDLLWTAGGAEVLSYADDALAREVAALASAGLDQDDGLARGSAVARNLAIADALARSLAGGEPAPVEEAAR